MIFVNDEAVLVVKVCIVTGDTVKFKNAKGKTLIGKVVKMYLNENKYSPITSFFDLKLKDGTIKTINDSDWSAIKVMQSVDDRY